MEFIQTHIPTVSNLEGIGQTIAQTGGSFMSFVQKNWAWLVIGFMLLGVFLYMVFSSEEPQPIDATSSNETKESNVSSQNPFNQPR